MPRPPEHVRRPRRVHKEEPSPRQPLYRTCFCRPCGGPHPHYHTRSGRVIPLNPGERAPYEQGDGA